MLIERKMRNWRELTEEEIAEMGRLYPTTTNRELMQMFDVSRETITDRLAPMHGWVKANYKIGDRGGRRLTEKETEWIIKHYKHTKNNDILFKFGIGESTLHRLARKHGLTKSRQFMQKQQKINADAGYKACEEYGIYEESRKRAVEQWKKLKAEGKSLGFKKGENNRSRLSKKKYAEMIKKMSESRAELIRKERMRVKWGLPQKTRLKVFGGGKMKSCYRHILKNKGYIVERGCKVVYYDETTNRSPRSEVSARNYGIRIEPIEMEQ